MERIPTLPVRQRLSWYDDLPPQEPQLYSFRFTTLIPAPWVAGVTPLLTIRAPQGQYLDVTWIEFFIEAPTGGAGAYVRMPDDAVTSNLIFRVLRDGAQPWNVTFQDAPNPVDNGFDMLNQNVMGYWGDTSARILVAENSTLSITCFTPNGVPNVPLLSRIGVMLCWRGVSKLIYEEVQG